MAEKRFFELAIFAPYFSNDIKVIHRHIKKAEKLAKIFRKRRIAKYSKKKDRYSYQSQ